MALPFAYPFKTRTYQAGSTSTAAGTTASVGVAARGKLIAANLVTHSDVAHTATSNEVNFTLNGTVISGWADLAVTTSTGNSATVFGAPTVATYVKPGDVLTTITSTVAGNTTVFVVREF